MRYDPWSNEKWHLLRRIKMVGKQVVGKNVGGAMTRRTLSLLDSLVQDGRLTVTEEGDYLVFRPVTSSSATVANNAPEGTDHA